MRAYTSKPLNVGAISALILQTQFQKKFVKIGLIKMYWLLMGNWPPKTKRKDFFFYKVTHLKYPENHFLSFLGEGRGSCQLEQNPTFGHRYFWSTSIATVL